MDCIQLLKNLVKGLRPSMVSVVLSKRDSVWSSKSYDRVRNELEPAFLLLSVSKNRINDPASNHRTVLGGPGYAVPKGDHLGFLSLLV